MGTYFNSAQLRQPAKCLSNPFSPGSILSRS